MNRHDRELSEVLQSIRAADAALAPSSRVETQLRAQVAGVARARRRRLLATALSVAAALTVVATVAWRMRTSGPVRVNRAIAATSRPEVMTTFFPLIYSNLPVSNAQLIRVRVPRSALASFGLAPIDVPAANAGAGERATVPADVLVGEDGVARAIRFVSP